MTATQLQFRRGTAAQMATFAGAPGEVVVDTSNNRVVVHDGTTAGGWPAATAVKSGIADSNATITPTTRIFAMTTLTAARTLTLPSAASFPPGDRLLIVDESGGCSATNSITVQRASSDTISTNTSVTITTAYGYVALESDGNNKWTVVARAGIARINQQVFTSSTTYTPSAGLLFACIECVGGGGGGGGAQVVNSVAGWYLGGGGGAGSYARKLATAGQIGSSQTVTIGSGGAGGSASGGPNNGSAGGDTSVGTLCVGKGGAGAKYGNSAQFGVSGAGGVAGTGDVTAAGEAGEGGVYNNLSSGSLAVAALGSGGSSVFGGGGQGLSGNIVPPNPENGNNASNYGGGGGGGGCNNYNGGASNAAIAAGGNGSAGIVIITEFCAQ